MLKGTVDWSKADEFGGTRLDFKMTNSAYQEIYGSAEMAVRPPKNFYNPAWRIRAPDDREVISNYIVLSESIQPRFEVLQGGYKMDRLMWVDSDKPDFQSSGTACDVSRPGPAQGLSRLGGIQDGRPGACPGRCLSLHRRSVFQTGADRDHGGLAGKRTPGPGRQVSTKSI
jgi:hypothetical protein